MLNDADLKALEGFTSKFPTWWYTIGVCDRSRDFTAAPQGHSPEFKYALPGNEFDTGFMCDHDGTVADAIAQVMADIETAIKRSDKKANTPQPDPVPVDRTQITNTSGEPLSEDHKEIKDNGQQKEYAVLSAEERHKQFIRPVREAYIHVGTSPTMKGCVLIQPDTDGCGCRTQMHRSIAETYARDPKFYGSTFCAGCGKHLPINQFIWEGTNERVGS